MIKFLIINRKLFLNVLFLILFNFKGFSQGNNYNCSIKNVKTTSPSSLEFDIFIEWTGTNEQKFTFFQAGINFNYIGMCNGGIITGSFKPGSADASLPSIQQKAKWEINQSSKQIRLRSAIAGDSIAISIPPPPGFRLGTFIMSNTVPFTKSAKPDFAWSFSNGSSSTTKTKVAAYVNNAVIPIDITIPKNHLVIK